MPDLRRPFRALPLLVLLGCQGSEKPNEPPKPAPVDPGYRADVETLCNVMERSGAAYQAPEERRYTMMMFLSEHITTDAGHDFMIAFKEAPEPADVLIAEAERIGLPGCPLAAEWR